VETNQSIFAQENDTLKITLASLDKLIDQYSFKPGKNNLQELYNRVGTGSFEMFLLSLPTIQFLNKARLEMKNSPYFGRFDIYEDGKPKRYYVGSRSEYLDDVRILNWKSTLSQLFYEAQSPGYFDLEIFEETRRIPVYQKVRLQILNSKLCDVEIDFSKDPTFFDKDKIIKPAINYRDIQRKPAKQVPNKEARSISSSLNWGTKKDDVKSTTNKVEHPTGKKVSTGVGLVSNKVASDRFLTSELKSRGDPKIHTIFKTFQSEQFRIVRLPSDQVLLVNGVAGSGKTSIGYHRLAYLSFEERSKVLESKKMLVFGPNNLFLSFVSELLPSLGTDGVTETTFEDWALHKLGLGFLDRNDQFVRTIMVTDKTSNLFLSSTLSSREKTLLWRRSRLKGSLKFGRIIKEIIENGFHPCPIKVDLKITISGKNPIVIDISKETFLDLWRILPNDLSVDKKLITFNESITNHISFATNKTTDEGRVVENYSDSNNKLNLIDLRDALKNFFTIYPITIYSEIINNKKKFYNQYKKFNKSDLEILGSFIFDQETIDLEDLAGILYVKLLIDPDSFAKHNHIMIDEGQDFSPLHYEIFNKISQKQSLTILGDIAQGIVAHRGLANWDELEDVFNSIQNVNLQISYRTTKQITDLANEVLHKVHKKKMVSAIPYPRYGKKPKLMIVSMEEDLYLYLVKELVTSNNLNKANTGILTKSEQDAIKVSQYLGNKEIRSDLILKRDQTFNLQKGITILPINLSKGLEFEKIILFNVSKANYDDFVQYDGRLLYVGITRALHELTMISLKEPTRLLKESKCIDIQHVV
jgi:DNA helicase-2/ATP-dependent DNA helicase PcrA